MVGVLRDPGFQRGKRYGQRLHTGVKFCQFLCAGICGAAPGAWNGKCVYLPVDGRFQRAHTIFGACAIAGIDEQYTHGYDQR